MHLRVASISFRTNAARAQGLLYVRLLQRVRLRSNPSQPRLTHAAAWSTCIHTAAAVSDRLTTSRCMSGDAHADALLAHRSRVTGHIIITLRHGRPSSGYWTRKRGSTELAFWVQIDDQMCRCRVTTSRTGCAVEQQQQHPSNLHRRGLG